MLGSAMGTEDASIKTGDTQISEEVSPMMVGIQRGEQPQPAGVISGSRVLRFCSDDGLKRQGSRFSSDQGLPRTI